MKSNEEMIVDALKANFLEKKTNFFKLSPSYFSYTIISQQFKTSENLLENF